jgi:alkylation response protein AidB-like acyl-CoA dehydrogenase
VTALSRIDDNSLRILRESMTRYRMDRYTFERRSKSLDSARGFDESAWHDYAEMGWLALLLPETHGGFDGDLAAAAALMEFVGAALAMEPVFASAVLSAGVLRHCDAGSTSVLLEGVAKGTTIVAFAHGESAEAAPPAHVEATLEGGCVTGVKPVVLHGDVATHILVTAQESGETAIACVDAGAVGVTLEPFRLVDGRGAARITFKQAPARRLATRADDFLSGLLDEFSLALCSETLGAIRALNDQTNNYLKTRKQFGRPIGANQALQHRMVELFVVQEELQAAIEAAHRASREARLQFVRATSAAAAHAASAARLCSHEAVQMHGGMGMTVALPVSHYFKRLMVSARLLGDRETHIRRFAQADTGEN